MNSETYKNTPYSAVFSQDFERGHIVYYGANSTEIQSLLKETVAAVMLEGLEPEKAYNQLKAAVQELVDEVN